MKLNNNVLFIIEPYNTVTNILELVNHTLLSQAISFSAVVFAWKQRNAKSNHVNPQMGWNGLWVNFISCITAKRESSYFLNYLLVELFSILGFMKLAWFLPFCLLKKLKRLMYSNKLNIWCRFLFFKKTFTKSDSPVCSYT